jgi:hypothetical protein
MLEPGCLLFTVFERLATLTGFCEGRSDCQGCKQKRQCQIFQVMHDGLLGLVLGVGCCRQGIGLLFWTSCSEKGLL